jgi:hypothetical protein
MVTREEGAVTMDTIHRLARAAHHTSPAGLEPRISNWESVTLLAFAGLIFVTLSVSAVLAFGIAIRSWLGA